MIDNTTIFEKGVYAHAHHKAAWPGVTTSHVFYRA